MPDTAFAIPLPKSRGGLDVPDPLRLALSALGTAMTLLSLYAIARWASGYSDVNPRSFAVVFHISTVVPAIPLGAYVLFARKGGPRHKLLGRIWLTLMGLTAFSTLFIRDVNNGGFSWLHIFTVVTFIAIPQAIVNARRRDFRAHRNNLIAFYTSALIIAGITAFAPGRTMWHWAFG